MARVVRSSTERFGSLQSNSGNSASLFFIQLLLIRDNCFESSDGK